MSDLKFEQKIMPEVTRCETFEEFQSLVDQWDKEGFSRGLNIPNEKIIATVESYQRDPEIGEVKLSSAFTNVTPENGYKGESMLDHLCIWSKKVEE
ncbi:hypothetical protein HN958_00820 [Candidatus Falkowbacteria bacterium]|jgi:hypothetical protein|nr:hypothetical protein [Candidatus Falkowbacteria bacterium]MBT7007033.1 hypothetical protein [Candidatus Falkowbacteria bacterium]